VYRLFSEEIDKLKAYMSAPNVVAPAAASNRFLLLSWST